MTDEVVTRLYRELVAALRRRDHPDDEPVKVAALYQDLVPYRAVRSRLGVELNADYEHALLRLLAGEHDLVRLEPAEARDELRKEAESPYPEVGVFREFSGSDVWVKMPDGPLSPRLPSDQEKGGEATPAAEPEPPESQPTPVATHGGGAAAERAPLRLHTDEPGPDEVGDRRRSLAGRACSFCGDALPERRRVRFCPHCGADQRLVPCPRCDAVLEEGWQYCISCGCEVRG